MEKEGQLGKGKRAPSEKFSKKLVSSHDLGLSLNLKLIFTFSDSR